MPEDLLHKVDVRHISEPVLQVLRELVNDAVTAALANRGFGQPFGALKSPEAARYIGVSRARLYELLKTDPLIQAASIKQGKSRLFLLDGLDRWLAAQQAAQQEPKIKVAA
jgi:Helix-turn-helix domain